jgi:hypothetical protein
MKATEWDHRVIDSASLALHGRIGFPDDIDRLIASVRPTDPQERERVLAEVAIAFIRWSQDLKSTRNS